MPTSKDNTSDQQFTDYTNYVDATFKKMNEGIRHLQQNQTALLDMVNRGSQNYDLRLIELQDVIGPKPPQLSSEFDAPHLWSTVGQLSNYVIKLKEDTQQEAPISKGTLDLVSEERHKMKEFVSHTIQPVKHLSSNIKSSLIAAVTNLKTQIDQNEAKRHNNLTGATRGGLAVDVKVLEDRIIDVEQDMIELAL